MILSLKEAISRALSLAQAEDVVLIAGKGHEAYQIFGDKRSPFSDISVVREYLIQNNYPQYAYHKRDYSGYPSHVSVR